MVSDAPRTEQFQALLSQTASMCGVLVGGTDIACWGATSDAVPPNITSLAPPGSLSVVLDVRNVGSVSCAIVASVPAHAVHGDEAVRRAALEAAKQAGGTLHCW